MSTQRQIIARPILREISARLKFLQNVGIGYLTLNRNAATLSGGEAQRIRLATQIGSALSGVLYVLDEPSIGLHQRDNDRLIETMKHLRDLDNTVLVVEHDEDTMLAADHLIEIGPGAGIHGGQIITSLPPKEFIKEDNSTARFLRGDESIDPPARYRTGNGAFLTIHNASGHNLQNITVNIPLGKLVGITGVSGSGKSTLINATLVRSLSKHIFRAKAEPAPHDKITVQNENETYNITDKNSRKIIDKIIPITQDAIGRTPRSNPATYTGLFDNVRKLFASTIDAKMRGYTAGRFSFNVKGGRCESCQGAGTRKIEMHFLPDIFVPCDICHGSRYNREALDIKYRGKNISEVLEMTIEDAAVFFTNVPAVSKVLNTLLDVGLGYIRLGQSAVTLSGGEAQRIKLANELARPATGRTLYVLDEPTTGLHFEDVRRLLKVIHRLVDNGNTAIIIEHNLDIIKCCDHLIDIGPEGGNGGGKIIAEGTPIEITKAKNSHTGHWLAKKMK